jgi:predicted permease
MARVFAALVRGLPERLRGEYGASMVESFESAYAEKRAGGGRLAAWRYALRAAQDVVATSIRERTRTGVRRRNVRIDAGADLRRAVRVLSRTPAFTLAAMVMLALGIGVNAAIFSAVKALLLTAPPYPESDRLVLVDLTGRGRGEAVARAYLWSYPRYEVLREMPDLPVAPMAGFARRSASFVTGERASRITLELVSPAYLELLGARAEQGRLMRLDEEDVTAPVVGVLSHEFWRRELGRDPAMVGRTIEVGSVPVEVVGVAQSGFEGLTGEVDVWLPLTASRRLYTTFLTDEPNAHWFQVVGRLDEGVTVELASARINAGVARIESVYPSPGAGAEIGGAVRGLREASSNASARTAVLVLAGAAGMVLLIACANLAGLLVARGLGRRHEMAVQMALGAGRGRVVRSLLVEHLLLAALGGVLALVVTYGGVRLLEVAWPAQFAANGPLRTIDPASLSVDLSVVVFAGLLTVLTGVLFGTLPALQLSRVEPSGALRSGGRSHTGEAPARLGGRFALIAAEVALALMLLTGAGLMTASLAGLLRVERGYRAENLLTFRYDIPRTSAAASAPLIVHSAFLERLRTDRRVMAAALGCAVPMAGHCFSTRVTRVDDAPAFTPENRPSLFVEAVSDDYFGTLGTPLRAGRMLDDRDHAGSPLALVINRSAARRFFGEADPLGHTLSLLYSVRRGDDRYTIVGVVDDILYDRPEQGTAPQAYLSVRQGAVDLSATVFVRTAVDPLALLPEIATHLGVLEPGAAIHSVETGTQSIARATADTRLVLGLLASFAGLAVLLSAAGIWSIVAYSVKQRTRELGLRMALGARSGQVVRLTLGGGAAAASAGLLIGLPAAFAGSRVIASLLFGVRATDVRIYAFAAAILAGVALLASWLPALRASRIDPMRAMRAD